MLRAWPLPRKDPIERCGMSNRSLTVLLITAVILAVAVGYLMTTNVRVNPLSGQINPRAYGLLCGKIVDECNGLVAINCKADVDGPFYYVEKTTGVIVGECGGFCEARRCDLSKCPPKEWTCGMEKIQTIR